MVGARLARVRQHLARERAQPPLAAIAHDGVADLLGDGEADALGKVAVTARSKLENEGRRGVSPAFVGAQKVSTPGQGD